MDKRTKTKVNRFVSLIFYCLLPLIIYFLSGCDTYSSGTQADRKNTPINTDASAQGFSSSPTLLSPADRAVLDNGCTALSPLWEDPIIWEFSWSLVENATHYQIAIHNADTLAIHQTVTTPGFTFNCSNHNDTIPNCDILNDEAQWHWRVRAGSKDGDKTSWGEWSAKRAFTVEPLEMDCSEYTYLLKFSDAWPPSPSPLEPDSVIKIHFNYYTPYYLGAYVKIVPYFKGNPWPENLYRSVEEIHYPPAYDGRIVEVDLHINAAAAGNKIDKFYFEIQAENKVPIEFLHIPVEYTVDGH